MGFIFGLLLLVFPLWKICARAGFPPAMALIAVMPGIGFLIVVAILAFVEWPAASRDVVKRED